MYTKKKVHSFGVLLGLLWRFLKTPPTLTFLPTLITLSLRQSSQTTQEEGVHFQESDFCRSIGDRYDSVSVKISGSWIKHRNSTELSHTKTGE